MEEMIWPPAYTVKKHPRARHVKLKATLRHGLELVVPPRFNIKHIPEILEQHRKWIEQQLQKLHFQLMSPSANVLPDEISLSAINLSWKITYIKTDSKKLRVYTRPGQELVLMGNTEDKSNVQKILTLWLKKQAAKILTDRLNHLSQLTQLPYHSVRIRGQRSRWGSCSADKQIILNYKLLFLPQVLMDHIIIHELCHTVHLNHSSRFWRKVASLDPQWKENSREVKLADKYIPVWLEM